MRPEPPGTALLPCGTHQAAELPCQGGTQDPVFPLPLDCLGLLECLQREALAGLSRMAQLACQPDCALPCGCSTA